MAMLNNQRVIVGYIMLYPHCTPITSHYDIWKNVTMLPGYIIIPQCFLLMVNLPFSDTPHDPNLSFQGNVHTQKFSGRSQHSIASRRLALNPFRPAELACHDMKAASLGSKTLFEKSPLVI